ncbi:hypothetical protein ERN12_00460 [Rhodobacteraceae bacterium]|nr:hypothetical protein ERN12_00460 [Paracoccaceae bacterium]
MKTVIMTAIGLLLGSGLGAGGAFAATATADLENRDGAPVGHVEISDLMPDMALAVIEVHDLPQGDHVVQMHGKASCAKDSAALGAVTRLGAQQPDPRDRARGDLRAVSLPDIHVGADGRGRVEAFVADFKVHHAVTGGPNAALIVDEGTRPPEGGEAPDAKDNLARPDHDRGWLACGVLQ